MGKIMHGDLPYGGSGSVVVPNPTDTATADLNKVKIDGTTYAIPQGGGGAVDDVQVDNASVVDQNGIAHINSMTGAGSSSAGAKGLVPAPASGDDEKFLAGDGTWKAAPSGGASAVSDLTDVDLSNLANGQILKYNATSQKWENANESGGGSGYSETTLFTGSNTTYSGEITLSDDLDKYDLVIFWTRWTATTTNCEVPFVADAKYFATQFPYNNGSTAQTSPHMGLTTYDNQYVRIKMGSANNKLFLFDSHSIAIAKVVGVKFAGGGGGALSLADLSDVDVETVPPTNGQILVYDSTNQKWINTDNAAVIANPSGAATAELTKISIGGVIYSLPQGGGGSSNVTENGFAIATSPYSDTSSSEIIENVNVEVTQ